MKLRISEKSLFAVLLRQPWWLSLVLAVGMFSTAALVMPPVFALAFALPIAVVAIYAVWKALRTPGEARTAETLEALRAMSWEEFSKSMENAFRRDGYTVARFAGPGADLELTKGNRVSLVACKRWKVARAGIEPLRELYAARRESDAHEGLYVTAGELSDNARAFAAEKGIRLVEGADLVKLLRRVKVRKKDSA